MCAYRSRAVCGQLLSQAVDHSAEGRREGSRKWKILKISSGELVSVRPRVNADPGTRVAHRVTALGIAHHLEPEAGGGAVEQPEQPQMLLLARPLRQLDHRCGLFEHFSAPVQDE